MTETVEGPKATILDVRLLSASADFKAFPTPSMPLTWELNANISATFQPGKTHFVVEIDFETTVREYSEDEAERDVEVATVEVTLGALYELASDVEVPQEWIDDFGHSSAMAAMFPYAREYVQNMTARMGLPPLTLSFLEQLKVVPSERSAPKRRSRKSASKPPPGFGKRTAKS